MWIEECKFYLSIVIVHFLFVFKGLEKEKAIYLSKEQY